MSETTLSRELPPFACAEHGSYYSDKAADFAGLQALVATGLDNEALDALAVNDPRLGETLDTAEAIAETVEALETSFAPGIRGVMTRSKTTEVAPLAAQIADEFVHKLGRAPDLLDINALVMEATGQVAFIRRGVHREVAKGIESGIVNELAALLLVRCDRDRLCHSPYPGHNVEQTNMFLDAQAEQVLASFGIRHPGASPIDPNFINAKQRNLMSLVAIAYKLHTAMPDLPPSELSEAETRELGAVNAELVKQIKRIRQYGIASAAFDTGELLPGTEAIYDEYTKLDMPNFIGELPLAIINFVPADTPPDKKFNYMTSSYERSPELKIVVSAGIGVLSVDHNGNLFGGLYPQTNGVPLKEFFAAEGKSGEYEYMRAILLSNLFDAVAPAVIVDRIADESRLANVGTDPSERTSSDIVTHLLLPRIKYLSDRSMKDVKKVVRQAQLEEEKMATASDMGSRRWHEVAAFLRPLPANAKGPSQTAIARAKAHFGEDYELPPGKTYVKKHERGDERLGRVVGHTAVQGVEITG